MNEDRRELNWSDERWTDDTPLPPGLDPALMAVLLQNISTRVAVIGPDRRYTYANREALRFMDLTADEVVGRHMSDVLDAGVYEGFVPLFDRLFAGESLQMRGWVRYQKQGRRYREQALVPYAPAGGPVRAVVVCGLDHTEQRLGELALAAQERQLRASEALKSAIVDHALAALVSTDAHGRIVEFNPSAQAMFGHDRAQVLGRPASEVLIPPRFRQAHDAGMQRLREGGPARVLGKRMELNALRADGSEFPMEMVLWRTDVDGEIHFTASIADLSARFEAAREIERQREALRQSEKLTAMGSLLAGVAHELNNPLAIVMGRASLLEEKCVGHAELQQDAQRIRDAAERCGRIVRTFLNMARRKPAERGPVSLNDLARAAIDMLAYTFRSHGIELVPQLDPQLPEVLADGDQIGQAVLNLLVNAQQALAALPGKRRVRVASGVEAPRGGREVRVWLRVHDSGGAMPAEVRERLFEPFFTTKGDGVGTGLGLSVSRALARDHGGDLVLEASDDAGTRFRLSLPVSGEIQPPTAPAPLIDAEPAPLGRVLVVDDEPELAGLMRDLLENAGYEVATAESGAVALELLAAARFDAIVSDLRMSDMDGAALWREVSVRHPALAPRMLFVTGDTLSPTARAFFQSSGCAGLDKPFSKAELLGKVAALLLQGD